MKLTPKLASALANLRGNRDFAVVVEGFTENVAEEGKRCTDGDGPVLYRAQGATKAVQWWLDAYRDAPKAVEKFSHPNQN